MKQGTDSSLQHVLFCSPHAAEREGLSGFYEVNHHSGMIQTVAQHTHSQHLLLVLLLMCKNI